MISPSNRLRLSALLAISGCALLHILPSARAQTAITSWTVSNSDAADSTAYSPIITFRNTTYNVTGITAGTAKTIDSTASSVYIRRNTDSNANGTPNQSGVDNNNYSSVWDAQEGASTTTVSGTYQATLGDVLLMSNNTLLGADNLFSNSSTAATTASANIERVDFYWSGGFTAISSDGFAVFDRGVAGGHDPFRVAVFTGWDSINNKPITYSGNTVTTAAGNYGANLDYDPVTGGTQATIANYRIFRYNTGDDLSTLSANNSGSAQGLAGVFISFADLGIAQGTTVYGYSIMASDTTTTIANLADWTNSTYYPTSTADANGGIDLMGFNGRRFVPEPSAYGAMFLGLSSMVLGFRRWLQGRRCA